MEIPPMDVVTDEILTKLPAKSLMRFKCVSKLWSSYISSRYFSSRFHSVPRLYMGLRDLNDSHNSVILSLAPETTSSSCFVVDHDLTIPQRGGAILQYLPGFICYTFWGKPRIYNPATRHLVTFPAAIKSNIIITPPPGEGAKVVSYYFGHDHVSDQYVVVCSTGVRTRFRQEMRSEHRVFFLEAGGRGIWKKAAPTCPADFRPHIPVKGGVCIDGVIYYLGWTDSYNSVLVSFHIRSGEFKMIQVPRRDGDELRSRVTDVSLIEYGGKVTLIVQSNLREKGRLDLWAVEDAGSNKWSRKTLVLQPSQLHLVNNDTIFKVNGTTQNGKVFLIPENLFSPFHILCYDLQSNDMRKIEIKGVPDHWFSKDKMNVIVMLMDHSERLLNVMHTG
ncbi:PREDICTED: F-box/LRR-repeat protein At2g40920-like [Camelina sativa]|uniref:F-box/LRR-repeat protein At2g40920-like n=1 Tax=Camelina sativa TaxID=90675 RepID=A0ABM0Y7K8_CAMSA|nr:PREDICTED: F-box/LRR-repeat protein At2g40920-like [Camelina sativa]